MYIHTKVCVYIFMHKTIRDKFHKLGHITKVVGTKEIKRWVGIRVEWETEREENR